MSQLSPPTNHSRDSSTKKEIPVGAAAAKAEADKAAKYSQFEEPGPSNCVTIAVEAAGSTSAQTLKRFWMKSPDMHVPMLRILSPQNSLTKQIFSDTSVYNACPSS
jgi:hypothetical protein